MAWMHVQLSSEQVRMPVSIEVLLPQDAVERLKPGEKLPVLYLLHDKEGDHSQWLKKAALETYQEDTPVAIVLPSGNGSYYVNLKYGKSYQNYIRDELPSICERLFPVSSKKEQKYLAGVGMGGYGALNIALTPDCPFSIIGAFQADIDMKKYYRTEPQKMEEIFGSLQEYEDSSHCLLTMAKNSAGRALPQISLMCTQQSYAKGYIKENTIEENREFYQILRQHTDSISLQEDTAAANWNYYGACLEQFMKEKLSGEAVWQ